MNFRYAQRTTNDVVKMLTDVGPIFEHLICRRPLELAFDLIVQCSLLGTRPATRTRLRVFNLREVNGEPASFLDDVVSTALAARRHRLFDGIRPHGLTFGW